MLLAGLAKLDITPEEPLELAGYLARMSPAEGLHDPVYCRAMVLEDGATMATLIACDVLGFGSEYSWQVRRQVEASTGIPAANVILAATHTHSAPSSITLDRCGEVSPQWLGDLSGKIVSTVQAALDNRIAVSLIWTAVQVPGVTCNRRAADQSSGPRDDELTLLLLRGRDDGQLTGTLANFACHPVVLGADNLLVSADYPGVLVHRLEELLGAPALFVQGASGDINPVDRFSFEAVAATGERLAQAGAQAAWAALARGGGEIGPLRCRSLPVSLPLDRPVPYPELHRIADAAMEQQYLCQRNGEAVQARMHAAMASWAGHTAAACASGALLRSVEAEVQCLEVGKVLLLALPGEPFVEFALEAKEAVRPRGRAAMVVGYAGGDIGYIASQEAYAQGGYEVSHAYRYYGYPAPLAAEASAVLRATIARVLQATEWPG